MAPIMTLCDGRVVPAARTWPRAVATKFSRQVLRLSRRHASTTVIRGDASRNRRYATPERRRSINDAGTQCDAKAGRDEADDRLQLNRLLRDARREPGRPAEADDHVVQSRCVGTRKQDEGAHRQRAERYVPAAPRLRVGGRDGRDQRFVQQRQRHQTRIFGGRQQHARIDARRMQIAQLHIRGQLAQVQRDAGIRFAIGAQQTWQDAVVDGADEAERQLPARAQCRATGPFTDELRRR